MSLSGVLLSALSNHDLLRGRELLVAIRLRDGVVHDETVKLGKAGTAGSRKTRRAYPTFEPPRILY
jgi:hypothetical protein